MDTIVTLLNNLTVLASSLEALYLKLTLCSNNHPLHVKIAFSRSSCLPLFCHVQSYFTGPRALSTHMWIDRGRNRNSCAMVSRRLHFLMASGTLGRIGWGRSMKGLGDWKWFLKHRIQRDQSIYMYIFICLYIFCLFIYLFIYICLFISVSDTCVCLYMCICTCAYFHSYGKRHANLWRCEYRYTIYLCKCSSSMALARLVTEESKYP